MQAGFFVGIRLARSHQKRGAEAPLVFCSHPPMLGRVVDQLIELAAALALVTTSGGRET